MIATLAQLKSAMADQGVSICYVKRLSANDNSKNQIYLGGNFEVLNLLPIQSVELDTSIIAGSKRERSKAPLDFYWLLGDATERAPHAQLVLYPKYPEVRLSGVLLSTSGRFSETISSREHGRLLFLGISENHKIIAFASGRDSNISREFESVFNLDQAGVFNVWPIEVQETDTKRELLLTLKSIYDEGFFLSQIRQADGDVRPYRARNGGGYTLESILGIAPNSVASPDFLGWEVKQYGTNGPPAFRPNSPITLMTPEPTSGFYREHGVKDFIKNFGYPDRSGIPNRLNFGGVYRSGQQANRLTGLSLEIRGYDPSTPRVFSLSGEFSLVTEGGVRAATWSFTEILKHWNRKHAQAAYISSTSAKLDGFPAYHFGPIVHLGEGTEFPLFLYALANSSVYLDPALKLITVDGSEKVKRRNQFRIHLRDLGALYHSHSVVDLGDLQA